MCDAVQSKEKFKTYEIGFANEFLQKIASWDRNEVDDIASAEITCSL